MYKLMTVLQQKNKKEFNMKLSKTSIATLSAIGLSISSAAVADKLVHKRFVVEYPSSKKSEVIKTLNESGATIKLELDSLDTIAFEVDSLETLRNLHSNSNLKIELDPVRKLVPLTGSTIEDHTDDPLMSDPSLYGIHMVQADEFPSGAAPNPAKVCVIDTGYDISHEDLPQNATGSNDLSGPWYGPTPADLHYHGTHVAGTIGAVGDNGVGVTGVVKNMEDTGGFYIVRYFDVDGGVAYASGLAGAIEECANNGATVVNMSLGGPVYSKVEERAFERARRNGILSIAAAGNDGVSTHSYPASYDSVMSVGALDSDKVIADFSQTTSQVEISAPGVSVGSTSPGDEYVIASGTSMASPHVAGVAALVWSHFPQCSNFDIRTALKASAEDLGEAGHDYAYGAGLVQAKAAYDYLSTNGCTGRICHGKECDPAK